MSYILEALRRADADRARAAGQVPGLQAVLMPTEGPTGDERRPGLPAWAWLASGLVLGVAVAAAMARWMAQPGETSVAPPPVQQVVQPVVQPVVPQAAPVVPPAEAASQTQGTVASSAPRADTGRIRPAPRKAPAAKPPIAKPPAAAKASAPAILQVGSLTALPAGSPALSFGGSVYSNAASQRLLIVNGQVLHEGDRLGANATLESIGPRSAVLLIRGQRYEVPY